MKYEGELPYIPYNSANKDYARFNRNNPTKTESLFRNYILKGDKTGFRFVRQKTLLGYIADFYCSKLLLVIEIDGGYHNETWKDDKNREMLMKDKGIKTIRFTNEEIETNLEGVAQYLKEFIENRKKELGL